MPIPILLPTSFKTTAAIIITAVLSVATAVSFTVPSVSHFVATSVPIVYDNTVFLLKPPYLYLVINCIIVSIVATSKLTQKSSEITEVVTSVHEPCHDIDQGYLNDYTGYLEKHDVRDDVLKPSATDDKIIIHDRDRDREYEQSEAEKPKPSNDSSEKETTDNPEPKIDSIPKKQWKKPPRFGQQKSLKTSLPQGGGSGNKKTALGVTKPPRRQDTLETTWKKITEGRSTPLTKHLTKSDTWQERTHHVHKREKVTKSDNLNDLEKSRLNREPSPGQEELNRRVEAFINKFNEEMRLQRLESLAKYNEMLNGGTPL